MDEREVRMRCLELAAKYTTSPWTYEDIAGIGDRLAATVMDGRVYGNVPDHPPAVCDWCGEKPTRKNRLLAHRRNGICFKCVEIAADRVRELQAEVEAQESSSS